MSKPTKYYSTIQEGRVADALGWKVVSGSGAAPCVPGDVISDNWLGECKTHTEPGHKIYFGADIFHKICEESDMKHRCPVLFADDGSQSLKNTWCVCLSHTLETNEIDVRPLNIKITKNLSFSAAALGDTPPRTVYAASLSNRKIYLMPFFTFQQIIEVQGC